MQSIVDLPQEKSDFIMKQILMITRTPILENVAYTICILIENFNGKIPENKLKN